MQATNPLPTNPLESFTYDEVGNRVNSNQNGASIFNVANQLLEDANFTYQYDNNGNLTRKTSKTPGPFTSYEYDAENKLVRVVSNGTVVNYKYDGLGRRVEKEINDGATTKVARFIYDNEDILLELDTQNSILARYTHGPGIDEPLVMEKGGASFFYHADGLGSITEITDAGGLVKQRYTYSSFGKIESHLDPSFVQPYTFTAREFDLETGLYFYRARTYDFVTGRFFQEDPILHAGNPDFPYALQTLLPNPQMLHAYVYVGGNPVNRVDAGGLAASREPSIGDLLKKFKGDILPEIMDMVYQATLGGILGAACASQLCKKGLNKQQAYDMTLRECFSIFTKHGIPASLPGQLGSANLLIACEQECERIIQRMGSKWDSTCCKDR